MRARRRASRSRPAPRLPACSSRIASSAWTATPSSSSTSGGCPTRRSSFAARRRPELVEAIRTLAVRGAPAIGIAAAYGTRLRLGAARTSDEAAALLAGSRPTAVNLAWALDEMRAGTATRAERAQEIHREEVERCRRMAEHAATLLDPGTRALTHCNAGGLATGGYGTAVGALRAAWEQGLLAHVLVDETRPLLQGARLTAWELEEAGIPHSVIADSAAGLMMARGEVDAVLTGADRIAANGDTANKIGTYSLAVLAAHHGIPLYVVAPSSTVDLATPTGRGDPDRGARRRRGDGALRRAEPGLRRHPGGADRGDRHRAGVHRAPYAESLAGVVAA